MHTPDPLKLLHGIQSSPFRRKCLDFILESRIPTRLQLEHEYPEFEDQLSQTNEQRKLVLLNYKICHKMHKPLNLHGYPGEFRVALTMNDARTTK